MAEILDGKLVAKSIKEHVKFLSDKMQSYTYPPKLVIVQVGDNAASYSYAKNKMNDCISYGIQCEIINFSDKISGNHLIREIDRLNNDRRVHGILLMMPLPEHIDTYKVVSRISRHKDIDGLNPINAGNLSLNRFDKGLVPCTPSAIIQILKHYRIPIDGKHCVIIGRGETVGRPLIPLLLHENATVSICHSHTQHIKDITRTADILISAIGSPRIIDSTYIRDGAVVIDAGMSRDSNNKLSGDVDFDDVFRRASYITPTPGGVGPVTSAVLLSNVISACELAHSRMV